MTIKDAYRNYDEQERYGPLYPFGGHIPKIHIYKARVPTPIPDIRLLDVSLDYTISIDTLKKQHLKQVKLPPEHLLWIELGHELPCPLRQAPVAAFWFINSGRVMEYGIHWQVEMISTEGRVIDILFYNILERRWAMTQRHAPPCTSDQLCQECQDYLNTWTKRIRQAVSLIQQHDYQPGLID